MATRFYLPTSIASPISPSFDSNWEQQGGGDRKKLVPKNRVDILDALADKTDTIPITTTQDVLSRQFVSDPIPPQRIIGTISICIRGLENNAGANAHIAYSLRVVSQDGGTVRGTLASSFATATELVTTAATRIISAVAVTALTTQPGDRLVLEIGFRAAAPTVTGTATWRYGNNAASDFALTSALTTDLNPWMELSQNIWDAATNNYQFLKVGDGMSVGEKIR